MAEVAAAWKACTAPHEGAIVQGGALCEDAVAALCENGFGRALAAWAVRVLEKEVINVVAGQLAAASYQELEEVANDAVSAVRSARESIAALEARLGRAGAGISRGFELRSGAVLSEAVPSGFSAVIYGVLVQRFREFGGGNAVGPPRASSESVSSRSLCAQLSYLGFGEAVEEAVIWILFEKIDKTVRVRTEGRLNARALPGVLAWVDQDVTPWLATVLATEEQPPQNTLCDDVADGHDPELLRQWRKRLSFHLHETMAYMRIDQMLQLIAYYPQSMPALEDLKDCLRSTDQRSPLIESLRRQFSDELLNAGTMTSDILQQYVNMIKALRYLDPTGVILEGVSDPVRNYLRHRPDTVRCIVSGMTGDGDLYEELEKGRSKRHGRDSDGDTHMDVGAGGTDGKVGESADDDCISVDGDYNMHGVLNVDDYSNWQPEPVDAPVREGGWRPGGDAIATLITIYGSSELLVTEYRALLADKLVSNLELDLEREMRILKLLTERFGNEAMRECSIMLKDVIDSRELLAAARSGNPGAWRDMQKFEATVVSKEFWPKLVEEPEFKASSELYVPMELLGASYEETNKPRKLLWQHGLGAVSLNLTFDDGREVSVTVTPLQASLLLHFGKQSPWTVADLKTELGMDDEGVLRQRLMSLANQGILRPTDKTCSAYETVECGSELESGGGVVDDDGAGDLGTAAASADQADNEEREMAVYESYIIGMLQNLKALPLERIHNMLQMFVRTPVYDRTQTQLAAFLAQLVAEDKIELHAGVYKIKPKA